MSDLISRQAAINGKIFIQRSNGVEVYFDEVVPVDYLKHLQPAESERKGEWTHKKNIYGVVYCSECDYELHTNDTNFCPNCGADMRGE